MYVALNWLEARLPIVDSWNEKFLHIERGRITKFGAPGMELNQAEYLYTLGAKWTSSLWSLMSMLCATWRDTANRFR